jgi:hypothetical protein
LLGNGGHAGLSSSGREVDTLGEEKGVGTDYNSGHMAAEVGKHGVDFGVVADVYDTYGLSTGARRISFG